MTTDAEFGHAMNRFVDRSMMLVAGALLGFTALRSSGPHGSGGSGEAAAPAISTGIAPAASAQPAPQNVDAGVPGALIPRGARPAPTGPLTDDEVDRCLVVASDVNERLHRSLLALQDADPAEFRARLEGSTRLRTLARLQAEEPHVYELKLIELRNGRNVKRVTVELQEAVRAGDESTLVRLREQLRGEMRVQQAFRLLARKQYLEQLRDRLEALENEHREDLATVDERIAVQIDEIIARARDSAPRRGTGSGNPAADRP